MPHLHNLLLQIKVMSVVSYSCFKLNFSSSYGFGFLLLPCLLEVDGQTKSLSAIQQQGPTQPLQPVTSASSGAISNVRKLCGFHWSHVLVAVSVLGASGAGTFVLFKVFSNAS